MEIYYQAYDLSGKRVDGKIACAGEDEAVEKLRASGLIPFQTSRLSDKPSVVSWLNHEITFGKPRIEHRANYCLLLAAMLQAGLPVDRANQLLAKSGSSRHIAAIAGIVADKIAAGEPLSRALGHERTGFTPDETGLIHAGEAAGSLAPALEELAAMLRRRVELRSRLLSASVYPIVLAVMALASIAVVVFVLAPNVAPLFRQSGREPPALIGLALGLRTFVANNPLLTLGIVASVTVLALLLARTQQARRFFATATYMFRIPRLIESTRLCRTLGVLLRQGVSLQAAMELTASALRSKLHQSQLITAREQVVSGQRLAEALLVVSVLSESSRDLIRVGEDTNKLDIFLIQAASLSEQEAGRRMERFVTVLTPLLTVVLGLLIGGLIMSVMRAILSINETVLP